MPLNPSGLTRGLIDRIKQRLGLEPAAGDDTPAHDEQLQGPAGDAATVMYRIKLAARGLVLLHMKYNNTWRHVEPYSFRYDDVGPQPKFFGYCHLHNHIEKYRLDRIQDVHVTDRMFNPRWPVEID